MDEMKEIEETLSKILYDEKDYGGRHLLKDTTAWLAYYKLLKNSELWLRYLLSECERLEKYNSKLLDEGIVFYTEKCKAEARRSDES
jgi:hypothetical protein